jgi:hypothetical protein
MRLTLRKISKKRAARRGLWRWTARFIEMAILQVCEGGVSTSRLVVVGHGERARDELGYICQSTDAVDVTQSPHDYAWADALFFLVLLFFSLRAQRDVCGYVF